MESEQQRMQNERQPESAQQTPKVSETVELQHIGDRMRGPDGELARLARLVRANEKREGF
jgi:hypothetical protein